MSSLRKHKQFATKRQRGFTLVVALLLLVALSLIGVAGLRNVTLQEKMSGNMFFRTLAFSEAEATLQVAENVAFNQFGTVGASMPSCGSTATLVCPMDQGSSLSHLAKDVAWTNSSSSVTPANAGFSSNWMNEDLLKGGQVVEKGCQEAAGASSGAAVLPCERLYVRTSARSLDTNSGALSITQQFFKFTGDIANANK
jgi:Tfp pilus assembly protein PilX